MTVYTNARTILHNPYKGWHELIQLAEEQIKDGAKLRTVRRLRKLIAHCQKMVREKVPSPGAYRTLGERLAHYREVRGPEKMASGDQRTISALPNFASIKKGLAFRPKK